MDKRKKLIRLFEKLYGLENKRPYGYQIALFNAPDAIKLVNKSRQAGISDAVAAWNLINALFMGKTCLIVSPSERQSKRMMTYIYSHLQALRDEGFAVDTIEETKSSITFEGGGEVYSLPNSPATIRGFKADIITFDEFAFFEHGTDDEVWDAVTPSISRGGEIFIISTPNGKFNRYYTMWHDPDFPAARSTIYYTECPDLDIEPIRGTYDPVKFRQEYENHFISDTELQEFPEELIQSCVDDIETGGHLLRHDAVYVGGYDVGRRQDMSALVVAECMHDGMLAVMHTEGRQDVPFDEQEHRLDHLLSNTNFRHFHIDETGLGMHLAENLKHKHGPVRPVSFTHQNKEAMVTTVKRLMTGGRLRLPDDELLLNSIRAIRRKYTEGNVLRFESDRRADIGHADLFWALALAVYGADTVRAMPRVGTRMGGKT
jgi:phage FluMu gp28-like protein